MLKTLASSTRVALYQQLDHLRMLGLRLTELLHNLGQIPAPEAGPVVESSAGELDQQLIVGQCGDAAMEAAVHL